MSKAKQALQDGLFTALTLFTAFSVNITLQFTFRTHSMTPIIFVLSVFLVAWNTHGYFWGVLASLISVLAENLIFTAPYLIFTLVAPEDFPSALVMLLVSNLTSTLTTRIKRQEKLKSEAERERMRGNLLRAVSHDLRTPLTSIYGACSVMIENYETLSDEAHLKLLQDIRADAQWLNRMVENLLSVTRVDSGSVKLTKQDVVLEELIDALLVKFHKHYPLQKVHVSIPEDFIMVPMDPVLIQQVLMNLLENAVFHAVDMKNLWLRVTVSQNQALFCVEDDGCGIPPERMERLFTGMLDSEVPTDTGRSNMGIGLSVCRTIIKAHGSDIHAENLPDGGARFSFSLEMEEYDDV